MKLKIQRINDQWLKSNKFFKKVNDWNDREKWIDSDDLKCDKCGRTKYFLDETLHCKTTALMIIKQALCEDCHTGKKVKWKMNKALT